MVHASVLTEARDNPNKWLTANYATKRRLLEIVCLNSVLDGVTLGPEMRKPFDVLAEGLVSKNSRGDCRTLEPLGELVEAFVTAVLELPPAHADSLAEIVATSGAPRNQEAGNIAAG